MAEQLRAGLFLDVQGTAWLREMDLGFAPFPGLGLRVGVYEVLNITAVTVGVPSFDVTCDVEASAAYWPLSAPSP